MEFLPVYFFMTLCIGFMIVYMLTPPPQVVKKYPNLKKPDNTTYEDDSGVCYRYNKERIQCPIDPNIKIIKT